MQTPLGHVGLKLTEASDRQSSAVVQGSLTKDLNVGAAVHATVVVPGWNGLGR
jgi:hypothetical protein